MRLNKRGDIMKSLLNDYIIYLKVNNRAKNTISSYKTDLNQLKRYLSNNNINITEIDIQILIDFLSNLDDINIKRTGKPLSANTKIRKISTLKDFFAYLHTVKGAIKNNPAIKLKTPRTPSRNPKYLSLDESIRLLNSIDNTRDLAMFTLFLNNALRLEEMANIKIFDIKGDTLSIIGKGNKQRELPLNKTTLSAINNYLKERPDVSSDYLFITNRGDGFSVGGIQYLVKKYLKKAGLNHKKYSTHDLRHTSATLMHNNGVDIRTLQEILGHADISTTQIYTHVNQKIKKKAINSNPLNSSM